MGGKQQVKRLAAGGARRAGRDRTTGSAGGKPGYLEKWLARG